MKQKINLLMVTLAYDPAIAFGGPVKVVQNNARELVRRGHRVTVYCTNRLNKQRKLSHHTVERNDQGVRVIYHNTWFLRRWTGNFGPFFSPGFITSFLREGSQFDIIHVNEARSFTTLISTLYSLAKNIPYIIQPHGSFTYGSRYPFIKHIYDFTIGRTINIKASKIIMLCPEECIEDKKLGISHEKITLLNNGIDLSTWNLSKENGYNFRILYGIPTNSLLLLFLGRIDKIKGPDLLIKALALLKMSNIYCLIAGPDDGYQPYVEKLVKEYGLSKNVIFTGLLKEKDIKAAYNTADIFVLPSRFDTFPMALVEALASGLPVLTTDKCKISPLIKNQAGLVTSLEVSSISTGLRKLIFDYNLRKNYSQGAKKIAEREFAIDKTVDRLEEIYHQILHDRS